MPIARIMDAKLKGCISSVQSDVAIGPWNVASSALCSMAMCIAVMSLKPMKTFGCAAMAA